MLFANASPHISIKPEPITHIGSFALTNSHLLGVLGLSLLVWLFWRTRAAALGKKKPLIITRFMQWIFEVLYGSVRQIIPDKKWADKIAPLVITIFFFILAQYWLGLLPIVGPITAYQSKTLAFPSPQVPPILRAPDIPAA